MFRGQQSALSELAKAAEPPPLSHPGRARLLRALLQALRCCCLYSLWDADAVVLINRESEVKGVVSYLKGKHQGDHVDGKALMVGLSINKGSIDAEMLFVRSIPAHNCSVLVMAPVSFIESAPAAREAVSCSPAARACSVAVLPTLARFFLLACLLAAHCQMNRGIPVFFLGSNVSGVKGTGAWALLRFCVRVLCECSCVVFRAQL